MAGTVLGSIEHFIANTAANGTRDIFAAVVNFLDNHPQMTRIASQAGSGPVGAAATALPGYSGSANYSGDNAFGVWRWDKTNGSKVYILIQWAYSASVGTAPGNPGVMNNTAGVGVQFAMDTSGGNPWNGGIVNNGTDAKNGTNVWVPNGGTLLVWPRANGPGGSGVTIRQYLAQMVAGTSAPGSRFHIMSDDDAIWWAGLLDGSGGYYGQGYFGPYQPRTGITPTANAGLVLLAFTGLHVADHSWTSFIGTTAGTSFPEGGAVVDAADGVRSFKITSLANMNDPLHEPNALVGEWDIHEYALRLEDSTVPTKYGTFGRFDPDMLGTVVRVSTHDTNVGKTKAILGANGANTYKFLFPWDGVTVPGSGVSVTGIQF
jgi:hypothetical protein